VSSGLYVSATLDIGDVEQGLEAMQRRAHALGAAFAELKGPLRLDQRDHSKRREGPEGAWAPRAASSSAKLRTGRRQRWWSRFRRTKYHRPAKLMGRLSGAVKYTANASGVTGVSRALWSGVHQDGGTVGHGSRIPARPFLWISDDMLTVAGNTLGNALVRAYGGR
jgi:phage gpG-like protein